MLGSVVWRAAHGRGRLGRARAGIEARELPDRHRAIAQAMAADERWEVVAERARHWELAGDIPRAREDWTRTAGEAAASLVRW